jgi:hypothetical protein|tara:strand:+ start:1979 stop:2161 length:183 start_codon:yes stop_codon:yes gene_type:complete
MKNELIKVNKPHGASRGARVTSATSASQGHFDDSFHKFSIPKSGNLEKPKYKTRETPLGF